MWSLHIIGQYILQPSPFQVVYGFNPRAPIDILPLPTSERIHSDAKEHADFICKCMKQLSTTLKI
jgi:hypothetical protein